MGAGGIYLIRNEEGNEVLVEMRPTPYDREDILQALIARFPNLLVGDAADAADQRWLLVGREAALPDDEDGGGRWSVDHLFLDQDAVPTLVEVKRAKDTRIRREVVGQVLDYAANAVVYWPIDRLRELFVRECERSGSDPEELVAAVIGADGDVEEFWQRANENLRAGRLRLVFVADEIPRELRRVIEFLNGQMLAEVLGIEVRQYVGEGLKTLVPTTVGQTAEAERRKRRAPRAYQVWDEQSFFDALAEKCSPAEIAVARHVYEWTKARGWTPRFGTGVDPACRPVLTVKGAEYLPIAFRSNGTIRVRFRYLASRPPFDDPGIRRKLLELVNEIPGISLADDAIDRVPPLSLLVLAGDSESPKRLEAALEWLEQTTRGSSTP
jgi:hypothetical protein